MDKDQLLKEMKQDMLRDILVAVKEIQLDESDEVCYVSLLGTDYEPVLGLITLGIKSYRDKMIQEEHPQALWYLWNSGEMPAAYQVGLEKVIPSFQEKQEKFVELIGDNEWEQYWEACQDVRFEVALQLNSLDWTEVLPVTPDFVLYSDWEALDVENGDLERSIPKEKLLLLRETGLI
ncbi:hypothetical protein C2I18_07720 [Paenibacillus sp. PK3_47]|uniref:hypothetical protein n=1 Tax=Paenibacillus sp. PK3_47 TaxID=2072642 RepID=UPI00201D77EA|nr:hypothetical protein [Paenibacillus sp. PK3_47]UQZ33457.1 hypothetical protein C2I18_07720 [Paenibacillus sp. PK3_47]